MYAVQNTHISFSIEPFEGAFVITPILNEIPLTELVQSFERERGFEPAGGYGGLIPQWFKYGPLDRYFLGHFDKDSYFGRMGRIYLLGCTCGEVGCWPLAARVRAEAESVIWDSFQQEHRPERDYSQFGPFTFEDDEYERAVANLRATLSAQVPEVEF